MFAWIYWDPSSEFLILPFLQVPITWYGILFATGFWLGFHLFAYMMRVTFPEKKKASSLSDCGYYLRCAAGAYFLL